jgi:DNA/RNA-binding domain of Phe-tRNA-synthetase-like protein
MIASALSAEKSRAAMIITVDPHPLLFLGAFVTSFPAPLGETASPDWLVEKLSPDAVAPVVRTEEIRGTVRDLLRVGGYKPTGRGKPASEYLVAAAARGTLPSINPAVDACNVVSLHSGLPISVIDPDRARAPFRVGIAREGERYLFNASGQEIDAGGLLCLHDAAGPCANAVKDAERTKTGPDTRRTLSLIWGAEALGGQVEQALAWYRELLARVGAGTEDVLQDLGGPGSAISRP